MSVTPMLLILLRLNSRCARSALVSFRSSGLTLDAEERGIYLETLVLLHNFRVRTGAPNQIRSVYAELLQDRALQEEAAKGIAAAKAAAAAAPAEDDDELELYDDDPALGIIAGMGDGMGDDE